MSEHERRIQPITVDRLAGRPEYHLRRAVLEHRENGRGMIFDL
jgi:hypothetical protein